MAFSRLIGQEELKKRLGDEIVSGLSHAYLFTGEKGIGKKSFAREFAMAALCSNPNSDGGCGKCNNCTYFKADTHPDFISLEAQKGRRNIKVDDLREKAIGTTSICSQISSRKVYLIDMDKLESVAQNALLKSIEEPPENVVFLFTASDDSNILPTVLSRVEKIALKPNTNAEVLKAVKNYLIDNKRELDEKDINFCVKFSEGNIGRALSVICDEELAELKENVIKLVFEIGKRSYSDILYEDYGFFEKNKDRIDDILLLLTWVLGDLVLLSKDSSSKGVVNTDCYARFNKFIENNRNLGTNNYINSSDIVLKLYQRIKTNVNFESAVCNALMQLKKELNNDKNS